jgi:hypothetical protein
MAVITSLYVFLGGACCRQSWVVQKSTADKELSEEVVSESEQWIEKLKKLLLLLLLLLLFYYYG